MKLAIGIVLLFVLAIAFVWIKARGQESAAEINNPPEGQMIDVNGHKVHAVVLGQGPDLVLIHGSSGNTRDMTYSLAPRLADMFRVIVLDRPGMGYTDRLHRAGATLEEQASLLSAAAAELGAHNPIIVGHSYGGAVALAWAVHHPERLSSVVALAAASHPWDTGLSTYYKILSHPVLGPLVIPLITAFVPDVRVEEEFRAVFAPDYVPSGYMDHFGPGLTLRRTSLHANAMQRANLHEEIQSLSQRYGEISVPLEILHGTADTIVGLEIHSLPLSKAVEAANLTRLEGAGHMIQHARENEVVEAIERAAQRAGLHPDN